MRSSSLVIALALLPAIAAAQQGDTVLSRQGLPRDVAREATSLYNGTETLRTTGAFDVAEGREIRGDVAVLNGPVTVAGRVTGRLLAINADVILKPSARIDGDLLVVGGDVEGRTDAYVGGEIRIYRQPLQYRFAGARIEATHDSAAEEDNWWQRWQRRRSMNSTQLSVASAGAYNRVEGLPIRIGPQIQRITPWGRMRLDAYAVLRTGSSFSSSENDVGHNVSTEIQLGRREGVTLGGRLFNVVDGVEDWQLSDLEVGLASFVAHRDYRDWYQRHGANAFVTGFVRQHVSLTGSFGEERWSSRVLHDPFTLFHNDAVWRPNPTVDEGLVHLATVALRFDTRNDPDRPASGWFTSVSWEHGVGSLTAPANPALACAACQPAPRHTDYSRGFVDVRRYNRLSPDAQLNFRAVLGGWVSGDPLPLERRLSVDGPGAMPGYGFRSLTSAADVGTCNASAVFGMPANCERIALAQVEYRGNLHVGFGDDDVDGHRHEHSDVVSFHGDGAWVLFMDAGRGWLVNDAGGSSMQYARGELPPLSTFRSDIGTGIDFGPVGVYVAKALSSVGQPVRFFLRLQHRF